MTDSIAFGGLSHRRQRFFTNSLGPELDAPTVSTVRTYSVPAYAGGFQDVDGGTYIIVTGTGFVDGCVVSYRQSGVEIASSSGGSVIFTSGELITAYTPGLPLGVYDVVVVNPDTQDSGGGGAGQHECWNPTATTTTGLYLPGDYATVGLPGINQVGTWSDSSGNNRDFLNAMNNTAPIVSSSSGSAHPAFDPTTSGLIASGVSMNGDFTTAASGAVVVIAKHTAPLATHGPDYTNPAMIAGSGATPTMFLDASGMGIAGYDALTYVVKERGGIDPDRPYLHATKWDAAGLYVSSNGETWSTPEPFTGGGITLDGPNIGPSTHMGMGYGSAFVWTGAITAVGFYQSADDLTPAVLAKWNTWAVLHGYVPNVLASPFENFACTSLHKIPYAGGDWAGLASNGFSGGRDLTSVAADPSVSSVDGITGTALFNGTTDYLDEPFSNAVLFGPTGGTFFCLMNCPTPPARVGIDHGNGNLYSDSTNAETTFGVTSDGFSACVYDSASYNYVNAPYVGGETKFCVARFDGIYLSVRVGRGPWVQSLMTADAPFITPGAGFVGKSYGNNVYFPGHMGLIGTVDEALTFTSIDAMLLQVESEFGVAQ